MFKVDVSHSINSVARGLSERIKTITTFFNAPYIELSRQAQEVARALSIVPPTKWEYTIDSETGLRIIKSQKDPKALDRVRQIANELLE